MTTEQSAEPLTYGVYLRVPELLSLQTPRGPDVHGEMLFIIVQQAQELWFKQLLHDLQAILNLLDRNDLREALRLLTRASCILHLLATELRVLESLPPEEFHRFRGLLQTASGFESEQFRELELASGLRDGAFLRIAARIVDLTAFRRRWPSTLADAFRQAFAALASDTVRAVVMVYEAPGAYPEQFALAEALSDYEMSFTDWRFQHLQLVQRVIGDRSTGTAGSAGSGYLARTLAYRFFPELWEARNLVTAHGDSHGS